MLRIDRLQNFNPKFIRQNQAMELQKAEASMLTVGGGLDTVSLNNTSKAESFDDVYNEMRQNVPDSTSTIKEKELAISYIDRMLACPDISPELKTYWENKKEVIEMEIQNIKNEQSTGNNEKLSDVWKEFSAFIDKHFSKLFDREGLSIEDKLENRMTYYNTYLSFCRRALACSDITPQERLEYQRMMANAERDIANWKIEYYNSLLEN